MHRRGANYRAALITGSSSGIGAAFARIMPPTTELLLTGRRMARLESLAAELSAPGRRIQTISADLQAETGRAAVIEAAERSAIDLLICNAGTGIAGDFRHNSLAAERETIAVNVVATVELLHALVPPMISRARIGGSRAGVIVVSSTAAFNSRAGLASYAASKSFQLLLAEGLAEELKDEPVDVLALCPTMTSTEFFARAGLPPPVSAMSAERVAQEGMAMLGRSVVHRLDLNQPPKSTLRNVLAACRGVVRAALR